MKLKMHMHCIQVHVHVYVQCTMYNANTASTGIMYWHNNVSTAGPLVYVTAHAHVHVYVYQAYTVVALYCLTFLDSTQPAELPW